MMEGTAPAFSPQVTSYLNAWAEHCAHVVSTVVGAAVNFDISLNPPPESSPAAETDLWFGITLSGTATGSMSLRVSRPEALTLAQAFVGGSQDVNAEFKPEHVEALEEMFRQIAGHVATGLQSICGEVRLLVEKAAPPTWSPAIVAWIHSSSANVKFVVEALLSSELLAALSSAKPEPVQTAAVTERSVPEVLSQPESQPGIAEPVASGPHASEATAAANNLDLVLDIELGVSLRFGSRQLLLKDILDLTAGSVVELDQQVQDPVDLLLDGKVIARGEVVVIDGNYGFRVTDVVRSEPARS